MNNELYKIIIGALLHDIGKFMQRAHGSIREITQGRREDQLKYGHACWTDEFFCKHVNFMPDKINISDVQNLAANHHNPSHGNSIEHIIQQADYISAGGDRKEREDDKKAFFKTQPLTSIFSKILSEKQAEKWSYKLNPLSSEIENNPEKDIKISEKEYRLLWDKFVVEFSEIEESIPEKYVGSLLYLLKKYTWCIPSDTMGEPDISLYDHLYTTAIFATNLYLYHFSNDNANKNIRINDKDAKKFLLITGDISGIQKFIFETKTGGGKGMSKVLRGRSFFISQLSLLACIDLLECAGMPAYFSLQNAGGNFKLILPNTEDVLSKLNEAKMRIDKYLRKETAGQLIMALNYDKELSYEDLQRDKFIEISKDASERLALNKMQPLRNFCKDDFVFEDAWKKMRGVKLCEICGKEGVEPSTSTSDQTEEKTGEICHYFRKKGTQLAGAKYLIIKKTTENFGIKNIYYKYRVTPTKIVNQISNSDLLFGINNTEKAIWNINYSNYVPICGDNVLSFEEIAEKSEGVKHIGVLKADVDNLGYIFSAGLKNNASISRYTALSRQLDYFFTVYLTNMLQTYKNIYTLFAGGDDLCFFGPWDKLLDFTVELQKRFATYIGNNSKITISAGFVLMHSHEPAYRAVLDAENQLEKSKSNNTNQGQKNSITLFDESFKWGKEFDAYMDFEKESTKLLKENKISKAFYYRLLKYSKDASSDNDIERKMWHPHLIYDIHRNIEGKKNNREVEELMSEIKKLPHETNLKMEKLKIPITIALYKQRGGKNA